MINDQPYTETASFRATQPPHLAPAIHRKEEAVSLALEFLSDLANPEGYGHAVSPEVVKRAARILALLRPKEPPRSGIGYEPPPPPRCEKCDSE